jgi:hypothetical protein
LREWSDDVDTGTGRQACGGRKEGRPDGGDDDAGGGPTHEPGDDHHRERASPDTESSHVRRPSGHAAHERQRLRHDPVDVGRKAEQFGQLSHDDRQRDPVEVADPDRLREQVREQPQVEDAERDPKGAGDQSKSPRERDGAVPIARGEGDDRRRDDGRQRRIRAEHEDSTRPQGRVDEQRDDGRVEPGDRREPGGLRVAHPDRDEDGRQD